MSQQQSGVERAKQTSHTLSGIRTHETLLSRRALHHTFYPAAWSWCVASAAVFQTLCVWWQRRTARPETCHRNRRWQGWESASWGNSGSHSLSESPNPMILMRLTQQNLHTVKHANNSNGGTSNKGLSQGRPLQRGYLFQPLANSYLVYYLTSEIGTTSLKGTILLAPQCALFGGSTVYLRYSLPL